MVLQARAADWAAYLKRLVVLLLLLVDYAEAEINFMGLVKVRLHLHDLGEGLLSMLKRAISVVQDTDTVPKSRLLRVERR